MEEQYKKTFDQMVDSLKMYQRYELKDKNRKDILDKVYVDPIENDGILNLCLKDNTTVLIGRRGTGKSTIFMRMQNELRKQNDIMTCYIDVKSIFDVAKRNYITINYLKTSNLEEIEQYSIQRQFILDFVDELINEICKNYDTIWEKFKQKLHISKSQKAIDKLKNIRKRIQDNNHLSNIEMQTLQEVMHSNVDNMSYCDKRSMKMDISLSKKKNILNESDHMKGFMYGGDDYLIKPFSPSLLVVRVNALFRRVEMNIPVKADISFGDVCFSWEKHNAIVKEHDIGLTMTEFSLLGCLMEHGGTAIPRNEILDKVWGIDSTEIETRVVDETVRRVRQKMKTAGSKVRISAVWGYGYKLEDCNE